MLAALVLAGELFPIQVHGVGYENFSTPFAFALLLVYGLPEAVAVQVVASLVADLVRRRPLDQVVFNLAQLAISWVAAGLALEAVGGSGLTNGEDLEAADLPAIAFSAAVFFIVNSTLVRTAEALLEHTSIAHHLRADLLVRIWSAGTLFALSLPVAVVSMHWLYLVPLLVLPMAAVHRASTQASEMEHLALHDALTGLPNRALLLQTTARALDGANGDQELALLVVDLDRFRDVNDTLGRAQGDAVLREVAARLKRSVRATDLVARVESDRFGVLLPDLARERRRRARRRQHPRRAEPADGGGGRRAERRRHGRHRLRPLARPGGRPAPPARRGRHVPRQAARSRAASSSRSTSRRRRRAGSSS